MKYIGDGSIKTVENTKFMGMLGNAIRSRTDGAYGNSEVMGYILEKEMGQKGKLVFDKSLPHSTGEYKLSTGKHHNLIDRFNKFLIEEKAAIKALKRKYGLD